MKLISTIIVLLLTPFTISWAQESAEDRLEEVIELQGQAKNLKILSQAWNFYKLGDYEAALGLWMPLAETGNSSAQVLIGLMYNQGHAVKLDRSEAAKWYALASEQGNAAAQWRLAILHYHGSGLKQDYQKAADLYRSAAKQGDFYSQKALAVMYTKGLGVPRDYVLAYSWFQIASDNGLTLAKKYQYEISDERALEEIAIARTIAKECVSSAYTKCGWVSTNTDDPDNDDP